MCSTNSFTKKREEAMFKTKKFQISSFEVLEGKAQLREKELHSSVRILSTDSKVRTNLYNKQSYRMFFFNGHRFYPQTQVSTNLNTSVKNRQKYTDSKVKIILRSIKCFSVSFHLSFE